MRRIWIDFKQPTPPLLHAFRIGLLVIGALALGFTLALQHHSGTKKTALVWQQQNLTRFESRKLPLLHASQDATSKQDASKHANEVLRQLNQPWEPLFGVMEQAIVPGISMLSVAPDPKKGTVMLKALAPNTDAAIDFIERLQANKLLTGVHLVSQEVMVDNKRQPLQFTVSAIWKGLP